MAVYVIQGQRGEWEPLLQRGVLSGMVLFIYKKGTQHYHIQNCIKNTRTPMETQYFPLQVNVIHQDSLRSIRKWITPVMALLKMEAMAEVWASLFFVFFLDKMVSRSFKVITGIAVKPENILRIWWVKFLSFSRILEIYISSVLEEVIERSPPPHSCFSPPWKTLSTWLCQWEMRGGMLRGVTKSSLFTEKCSFFCVKGSYMGRGEVTLGLTTTCLDSISVRGLEWRGRRVNVWNLMEGGWVGGT